MPARKKLIIIAIFVIATSLFVIVSLFSKKYNAPLVPLQTELILESATKNATVGEQFKFSLFLKSSRKDLASFDAVVLYDPTQVSIDEIRTLDVFPQYPRKLIEDFKNRFVITGLQTNLANDFVLKSNEIAEISATPLKTGNIKFQFFVDGRKFTNVSSFKAEEVPFKSNELEVKVGE